MQKLVHRPLLFNPEDAKHKGITQLSIFFGGRSGSVSKHAPFLEQCLNGSFVLEGLKIDGSSQIKQLPDAIKKHPIKHLTIFSCSKFEDIESVLQQLPLLENLYLAGKHFHFGQGFAQTPHLKTIQVDATSGDTLESLGTCYQLEKIILKTLNIEHLSMDFSRFKQLKELTLNQLRQLKQLPTINHCHQLNYLSLSNLPSIEKISIDFTALQQLETVNLQHIGKSNQPIQIPPSLGNCQELKNLILANSAFETLPDSFSNLKSLTNLSLHGLAIKTLPEMFTEDAALLNFQIYHCHQLEALPLGMSHLAQLKKINLVDTAIKRIDIDFSKLVALENFELNRLPSLCSISDTLGEAIAVKRIALSVLPILEKFPLLGKNNPELQLLYCSHCPKIQALPPLLFKCPKLKQINLNHTGIQQLPKGLEETQTPLYIQIHNHPNLQSLPEKALNKLPYSTIPNTKEQEKYERNFLTLMMLVHLIVRKSLKKFYLILIQKRPNFVVVIN